MAHKVADRVNPYQRNFSGTCRAGLAKSSTLVFGVIMFAIGLTAGGVIGFLLAPKPPPPLEKVTFQLDWIPLGRHTAYYVALEKGFYTEVGLDVAVTRGSGSGDAIRIVGAGEADIGFADLGTLIEARSESVPVKMVAVIYGEAPHAVFTLKGRGIESPKDLEGQTLGGPPGESNRILFPAFANLVGIDLSRVGLVDVEAGAKIPLMLAGTTDATWEYIMAVPNIPKEQQANLVTFRYSDYGLTIYSNGIVVSDDVIKNRPDFVRKFVQATIKGWDFVMNNRDESASIMVKFFPHLSMDVVRGEIDIVADKLLLTEEAKQFGLGWMTKEKVESSIKIIAESFNFSPFPAENVYTTEFLGRK